MKIGLLAELIDGLRAGEVEELSHWLACPLHNSRPELGTLFAELCRWRRELRVEPDPDALMARVRPGEPFSDQDWRQCQHRLLKCCEAWLSYRTWRATPDNERGALLQAYRERDLSRHLKNRLNRFRTAAERQPAVTVAAYAYRYQLERERYRLEAGGDRTRDHNLREQETALLHYLLAGKLRQACQTLAHLRVYRIDYDIPLLTATLEAARATAIADEPGIYLYYLATRLYLENEDEGDTLFQELIGEIDRHIVAFPAEEQRNLLVLALNHGLRNSNAGRAAYLQHTFALYRLGIDRNILYERGELSIFTFNNIIGVALRLGEIDWAARFLADNEQRLPPERREEVLALNRARLTFQRGDYDATLRLLQSADYRDFIHHMTARIMQLKIYFAGDHFNLLTAHLRSTRALLRRRRHVGYHQTNYTHIFDLAEQLLRLPPGDTAAARALAERIRTTDPCTERDWLLQRLEF